MCACLGYDIIKKGYNVVIWYLDVCLFFDMLSFLKSYRITNLYIVVIPLNKLVHIDPFPSILSYNEYTFILDVQELTSASTCPPIT